MNTTTTTADPGPPHEAEKLLVAVFSDQTSLTTAVEQLLARGVPPAQISVVLAKDTQGAPMATGARQTETRGNESFGTALGALLGGVAMLGAVVVMGPLALVTGVGLGGMVGGLVGALLGAGVTEAYARRLDEALPKKGGFVLLHTPRSGTHEARQLLTAVGGRFIEEDG